MKIVDIEDVNVHLSELVDEAANGQPLLIAIDGKSVVRVEAFEPPAAP